MKTRTTKAKKAQMSRNLSVAQQSYVAALAAERAVEGQIRAELSNRGLDINTAITCGGDLIDQYLEAEAEVAVRLGRKVADGALKVAEEALLAWGREQVAATGDAKGLDDFDAL